MVLEIIFTILVGGLVSMMLYGFAHSLYEAIADYIQNKKDAVHKYTVYNNRLFETVVYVHAIEDEFCSYYKADLYEIIGKKKILRDYLQIAEKEELVPSAEEMLLNYLAEETEKEIKQKTFEQMLDNFRNS